MKKKLIILGAAESGVGAAVLALQQGYDVFVSDNGNIALPYKLQLEEAGIQFEENRHTESRILAAHEIIKSPGIPEKNEIIKKIRAKQIPVISEIEFAWRYKGKSKVVAITGSNGKTTSTALVYHMCRTANVDAAMVGNVGESFALQIAIDPKPVYVVEVSSFQLDDTVYFKPDIAILTNITEDHLDRYDYKIKNYIRSKFSIAKNQTEEDVFIYNLDDENTIKHIEEYSIKSTLAPITMSKEIPQGAYLTNAELHIKWKGEEMKMSIDDFTLKGRHNLYNGMAAGLASSAMGIRKDKIRESLQTFETLEHRMEPVATIRGVQFINDSKATNVNSTWFALESMTRPTILILGGVDKGNDYTALIELVREKVKAIVCLGKDNIKIHQAFGEVVSLMVSTESAEEAVKAAFHFAEKDDVVLLSPACASFDLFKNYEDRGRQFKEAVKDL